jgi:tetratricopeptide (TPR) repeat protein
MLRRLRVGLWSLALPLCVSLPVAAAPADDCQEQPEVCGRRAFEAGIAEYRAGRYPAALEHFVAAQRLKPHPAVLFNLALAEVKLGLPLEASEHFEQVASDPNAAPELAEKARVERDQAERSLALIELEADVQAEVRIDGRLVAGRPPRQRVNPGKHRVVVVARGKQTVDRVVELREGERLLITLDVAREQAIGEPAGAPAAERPPARGPSPWWFYGGIGLTAVLGGVTVWSALDTQAAYDAYSEDLASLDQRQVDERVRDGHSRELRTNLLIGATAVAAAGTAILGAFVVDFGSSERGVSVRVTPSGIQAAGRF